MSSRSSLGALLREAAASERSASSAGALDYPSSPEGSVGSHRPPSPEPPKRIGEPHLNYRFDTLYHALKANDKGTMRFDDSATARGQKERAMLVHIKKVLKNRIEFVPLNFKPDTLRVIVRRRGW